MYDGLYASNENMKIYIFFNLKPQPDLNYKRITAVTCAVTRDTCILN